MISNKISIETMRQIFMHDAKVKCDAYDKMIYQSVLAHHFKNKITNIHLLSEFSMSKESLKFEKFKKHFLKLQEAELIKINSGDVLFLDVWAKYVNLTEFGQEKFTSITVQSIKDELYQSHSLNELIRMKYKVTIKRANDLLILFIKEQEVVQTQYNNEAQIRKHFVYWCQSNLDKINSAEQVKSKSKILGKK